MHVGNDGSESRTSALKLANGKVVIVDCNPGRLVLGAATKSHVLGAKTVDCRKR